MTILPVCWPQHATILSARTVPTLYWGSGGAPALTGTLPLLCDSPSGLCCSLRAPVGYCGDLRLSALQVYKVMAPNRKIYALKRIRLTGRDREAAAGFIDEITLLQRLRGHSNIIQLIDAEVGPVLTVAEGSLSLCERRTPCQDFTYCK